MTHDDDDDDDEGVSLSVRSDNSTQMESVKLYLKSA